MGWDVPELIHQIQDALPIEVRATEESTDERPVLVVSDHEHDRATIGLAFESGTLSIAAGRGGPEQVGAPPSLAVALLVVLCHRAPPGPLERVVIDSRDPIFRAEARRLGFTGGLREPLRREGWDVDTPTPAAPPDLVAGVATLVPGVTVVERTAGLTRRGVRRAATQTPFACELEVDDGSGLRPLRVVASAHPDVFTETVASAIDTITSIRRAFGEAASSLRTIAFEHSAHELRKGRYAATAHASESRIRLNASYLTADSLLALQLQQVGRTTKLAPAVPPHPYNAIDGTVAHECWHLLESAFQARHYTASIEFRRQLGRSFGVDTLEKALYGGEKKATDAERAAIERIRTEVSGYATSNVHEATAEMFKVYWLATDRPSELVVEFGRLVETYFPVSR